MKPRVVLDTNVVVSAFLNRHGKEALVLRLGLHSGFQIYISEQILHEYETVLHRPKFGRPPQMVDALMEEIRARGELAHPTKKLSVSPHEPDNRFLECAQQAKADFLVTGNKRHFPKHWKTTIIVSAQEFLKIFISALGRKIVNYGIGSVKAKNPNF